MMCPRTYLLGTMATLLKFARPINAFRIQLRSWTIGGTMAIPVPASRGLLVGEPRVLYQEQEPLVGWILGPGDGDYRGVGSG